MWIYLKCSRNNVFVEDSISKREKMSFLFILLLLLSNELWSINRLKQDLNIYIYIYYIYIYYIYIYIYICIYTGADSGLVKLVVMTIVFFNTKSKLHGLYALNR